MLIFGQGLYVAGTPFINEPWKYDQYSPVDLTLLDFHFGDIEEWRAAVDAIHARGMYILLDNTMSTWVFLQSPNYYITNHITAWATFSDSTVS